MLVTVATYTNPLEAHIVRGRLQAEGIEAYVAHEHHIWANWFLSTALGGVKLQVAPADAQRAREILRQEQAGDYAELMPDANGQDTRPQATCPACRSPEITAARRSERISLLVVWLSSLPLPYNSVAMVCRSCGHNWVDKGAQTYPVLIRFVVIALLALLFLLLIRGLYYLCSINEINPVCG